MGKACRFNARQAFEMKLTNISSLLNVESVSDEGDIWVQKSHNIRDTDLELASWVKE